DDGLEVGLAVAAEVDDLLVLAVRDRIGHQAHGRRRELHAPVRERLERPVVGRHDRAGRYWDRLVAVVVLDLAGGRLAGRRGRGVLGGVGAAGGEAESECAEGSADTKSCRNHYFLGGDDGNSPSAEFDGSSAVSQT